MVGSNFEKLAYILSELEEIDPILLDQLNYFYLEERKQKDDDEELDENDDLQDFHRETKVR